MEESALRQPELIGREAELSQLKQALDNAVSGKGSTIFIAGETGIGKTRLVSELITEAEAKNCQIIRGWCLAESLEPLMPVKTALREAGLLHLISGDPPPLVVSAYLMNDAGMLIAKAEREQLELDSDIFAGMLQAVGNFVKDSLEIMDSGTGGGLNTLGYADYTILIRTAGKLSLATVIKGEKSEFLIEDMKGALAHFGSTFDDWSGNMAATEPARSKINWFMDSGKYDGKFLVDDPKLKQENLFDNVLLGLQRASAEKQLLIFLDDLQWADPTTLNLLHYLARNTRKDRVLMLGTYRPEDIVQGHDGKPHQLETAMQNMSREDLLEKVELNRLDRNSTKFLINGILGVTKFEPGFYDKIHRESGGTPFFVLEVVKLLAEEQAIAKDETGAWALVKELDKLDLPSKVYDVVKRRLDRLMKEQRKILDCASVVGEEFQSDLIGKVMGQNKLQLLENLSEIEKTHKLLHYFKDRYKFDHAKVREVLYNGIGEELRREYHRLIADTIAEIHKDNLDGIVSELAYHYFEAGDEKAGVFLIKAADKAAERYANEEAVRLYGNALNLIGEKEKPALLEKLADVQALMGEFDRAICTFEMARDISDDDETKARTLRKIGAMQEKKGDYDRALKILDEARKLAEPNSAEYGRILLIQGYPYQSKAEYDKALALYLEAVSIAERIGTSKKDIGNALRAIGSIYWRWGEYEKAMHYYERSLAVMEDIGDRSGIVAALNNIAIIHGSRGEQACALEFFGRSLDIVETIGNKHMAASLFMNIGVMRHKMGEMEAALNLLEHSLEIRERLGDKRGIADTLSNIADLLHEMDDMDKALGYLRRGITIAETIGDKRTLAGLLENMGCVLTSLGELDKARECHEKSQSISVEIGERRLKIYTHCHLAEIAILNGEINRALEHANEALLVATEMGGKLEEGKSHCLLGMVHREMGCWKKADEEFRRAEEILLNAGETNELTLVSYERSLLFKAMGDQAKARESLEKALAEFERMGMKLWAGKCQKALEGL